MSCGSIRRANAVPASPRARSHGALFAGVAALLLVGASGAGWWLYRGARTVPPAAHVSPMPPPATTQAYIPPPIGLSKAPRLSIVVLPFGNLSGDPKEDYLAEGITEDVTTDLSRVPGMFVIARESPTRIRVRPSMCARLAMKSACATRLRAACASLATRCV